VAKQVGHPPEGPGSTGVPQRFQMPAMPHTGGDPRRRRPARPPVPRWRAARGSLYDGIAAEPSVEPVLEHHVIVRVPCPGSLVRSLDGTKGRADCGARPCGVKRRRAPGRGMPADRRHNRKVIVVSMLDRQQ
jgi:hypothetical protein